MAAGSDEATAQLHDLRLLEAKEAAYYGALVQAWFSTRMERDRTIIALSAGGVGVLVTLLTSRSPMTDTEFVLYILDSFAFMTAIVAGITVLQRNSDYIVQLLRKPEEPDDRALQWLDRLAVGGFALGLVLALTVGIVAGAKKLNMEERSMAKEPVRSRQTLDEAFHGANALRPSAASNSERSFNGAASLAPTQPVATQPTSQSSTQQQQPAQPASQTQGGGGSNGSSE
ncbi:MAG TPA: hypothetical protein VN634_02460 [Candidatus Limnocylindrales bacterium]|nr:hypothetical protein [Candidatus Limnocylindrales bacterium]